MSDHCQVKKIFSNCVLSPVPCRALSFDQVQVEQPLQSVELGSPRQQEGIHLHGMDGHGERLLHLHPVVHQGEGHLFDVRAEELREDLV